MTKLFILWLIDNVYLRKGIMWSRKSSSFNGQIRNGFVYSRDAWIEIRAVDIIKHWSDESGYGGQSLCQLFLWCVVYNFLSCMVCGICLLFVPGFRSFLLESTKTHFDPFFGRKSWLSDVLLFDWLIYGLGFWGTELYVKA